MECLKMGLTRDDMFQVIRVTNLLVGLMNIYLYGMGGGPHLFGLAMLNIAAWSFTRGVHK
jgi:hypothetical protein